MAILKSNFRVKNIWRTPLDFTRTPRGGRTPGWEPLLYNIIIVNYESPPPFIDTQRWRIPVRNWSFLFLSFDHTC